MKKKVLLLSTVIATLALTVSALAFFVQRNDGLSNVKGQNEPTPFQLDYSTVSVVDENTYRVLLKADNGSSVPVNVVGVTYQDGFFKTKGSDFYIYNTEESGPLRGIQAAGILFLNNSGSVNFTAHVMFSYNELSLNKVLEGKYQDLYYHTETQTNSNSAYLSFNSTDIPELADSRYFMYYINPSSTFSIYTIVANSLCSEEPTPVEEGTYDGSLSEEEQNKVQSEYAGSLNIDTLVNPMYKWVDGEYENQAIRHFYKKGTTAPIISKMLENGYTKILSFGSEDNVLYQKKVGGTVHSITTEVNHYSFTDEITASYSDGYAESLITPSWPAAYINSAMLSAAHRDKVPTISDESAEGLIDSYIAFAFANYDESTNGIGIFFNLHEGVGEEEITPLFTDFATYATAHGWSLSWRSGTSALFMYDDGLLQMYIGYSNGQLIVEIMESITRAEPPSANEIANALGVPDASNIITYDAGSGAKYMYQSSSKDNYRVYDAQDGAIQSFADALIEAGYVNNMSNTYKKTLDIYGSYLSVNIVESSVYQFIDYSYQLITPTETDSFENMLDAISSYSSESINTIVNSVSVDPSYEYLYVNSSEHYGIVVNAGQSFIDQFASIEGLTYIAPYDAYMVDGSQYLLKLTLLDGAVRVESRWYSTVDFYNYEVYNTVLASFITNRSLNVADNAVEFTAEDNTIVGFNTDGYSYGSLTYWGSQTEVQRVKALYTARILATENFQYSQYLDMYVNSSTGFAYQFSINSYSSAYYLRIYWKIGVSFEDYQSYNDLDLGSSELLTHYPSFIADEAKDEPYFAHCTISADSIAAEVSKEAGLDSYTSDLLEAGFVYKGEPAMFSKLDGAYLYVFQVSNNGNTWHVGMGRVGEFLSASDYLSSVSGVEGATSLLSDCCFSEVFTANEPAYVPLEDPSSLVSFGFLSNSEYNDYRSYLSSNGFFYESGSYVKFTNEAKTEYVTVSIGQNGPLYYAKLSRGTISFSDWNSVLAEINESSFDYDAFKDVVAFPITSTGNYYSIYYTNKNEVILNINKAFDFETYIDEIEAHSEFVELDSEGYYVFETGYISITEKAKYFQISINVFGPGESFWTAFIADMGENAFTAGYDLTYFVFVPEVSGTYTFTSSCTEDMYGYLFDEVGEELIHDDDSAGSLQFEIKYQLEAGKTYYIGARTYRDYGGTFEASVIISKF